MMYVVNVVNSAATILLKARSSVGSALNVRHRKNVIQYRTVFVLCCFLSVVSEKHINYTLTSMTL